MSHYRGQIRAHVVTLLTGLTTAGTNVLSGRGKPLQKLPAWRVRPVSEISGRSAMGRGASSPLDRAFEIALVGYASGAAFDDTLDDMAAEAEAAMGADPKLGGLVIESVLARTEFEEFAAGDKPGGSVTLVYRITFRTPIGDPENSI